MNLKNIIQKSLAITMAITIVFGNISICGIGISEAIAESSNTPDIKIELQNEKYVQYKEENNTGVAVQSKLSISSNQTQENYLPTENVVIEANLPKINGHFPVKAIVAESKTIATTGEELNTKINQNYNPSSGLLTIYYENIPDDEGKIYSEYKENVKDEFEIIYIYPAEAYTGNEKETQLEYNINVDASFKTENAAITSTSKKTLTLIEKDNRGDITTFNITKSDDIYKGFMYSNVENQTNYETEYKTISTLCVLNSDITNEISMVINESNFLDENEELLIANANTIYKETGISKYEFDKILGTNGKIEFYQGEEITATVSYITVDENETKKLAVSYIDGPSEILKDEDTTIIVKHPENTESLKIKTTKPITEGFIHFENQNAIKATNDYGCNEKEIKYIRTQSIVNDIKDEVLIELKAPETKIKVEATNKNFSTLKPSNTTITIKLDDTNASTKLFDNPTITLTLPKGLVSGNLSSPEIVNGNGLVIESATAKDNVITIKLKGKQTEYDLKNVSGGTSIVMDFENIKYNNTLPTHTDKIEATCEQGKEIVKASQDVNINSKEGLLILSNLSDNGKNILTTIDNDVKTVKVKTNDKTKELVNTINLVNNYENKLTDMEIIGRLGYNAENINSSFDANLTKPIEVKNANATVYYSNNKQATSEDQSWTKTYSEDAKAFKIVLENNEMEQSSSIEIKEYVGIPASAEANTYLNLSTSYKNNNENKKDESTFGIQAVKETIDNGGDTEKPEEPQEPETKEDVSVKVTPLITQNYVHAGQVVTYKIQVTNNTDKALTNVKVVDAIPENAIYSYYKEVVDEIGFYTKLIQEPDTKQKDWTIDSINPGETAEREIMLTMSEQVTAEQEVKNIVKTSHNEQEIVKESKLQLKPSNLGVTLKTKGIGIGSIEYVMGEEISYYIIVENTTNNVQNNVKVQYQIPKGLEYKEGGKAVHIDYEGYVIETPGTITNNVFEYNIDTLDVNEEQLICVRVEPKQLSNKLKERFSTIATITSGNEIYNSNLYTIEIKQPAFEMSLNVNTHGKEILEKDDEVTYTITAKNIGEIGMGINIKDKIPEELEVQEIEYSKNNEEPTPITTSNQDIEVYNSLDKDDELIVKIKAKVKNIEVEKDTILTVANKAILEAGVIKVESNEVSIKIKPEVKKEEPTDPNNPTDPENPSNPTDPENPDNPTDPENPDNTKYSISGTAWIDENKDGKKDENEKLQDSVIVSLLNKQTGNFATDANGNKITATTDANGKYSFNNLPKGEYIVLFEFDTNTYTVTTYQKTGVSEEQNSDVILSKVTINGTEKLAGITDAIILGENKQNVDIGLITNATFDLSLDKQITKVTVSNSKGTEVTEYEDGETAKVDLVAKYMNTAKVIVNYKFTVTNNGDITGYVNSLVDNLPSGLEFSSELNKDWYKGSDGKLYTTALSSKAIKPGESTTIELVLTKNMTEENTGVFPNSAKLEKISNLENIQEKENALENNESSATLIISIKTGSVILYIGITLLSILIITAGTYVIKKKVLDKGI